MALSQQTPQGILPKTLEQLTHVNNSEKIRIMSMLDDINSGTEKSAEAVLKLIKDQNKEAAKLVHEYKILAAVAEEYYGTNSKVAKVVKTEINKHIKETTVSNKLWNDSLRKTRDLMSGISKTASDMYKTAHEMQLESNLTWKEYSALYEKAFDSARQFRNEIGKSLFTAKELVAMQNALLGQGWKGVSTATLTNMSLAMAQLQKTVGKIPEELNNAFRLSYLQFGEQNTQFVTALGNRLNAFSNTFGTSIGMLTGVVSQMMTANNFIARNNMQAQVAANESLMKAAALSGSMGLMQTNFITSLAQTSQFGTMQEVAKLYEGGALLQDFSTEGFQDMMTNQDYEGATSSLFAAISKTLNGIDDRYIRAEYMKNIGSSFGLSDNELLQIANNGDNLSQYEQNIQDKLLNVNTSMKDELTELRISVMDRLENWWENTGVTQGFSKTLQDLGLVGMDKQLMYTNTLLTMIVKNTSMGNLSGALGGGSKSIGGIGTVQGAAGTKGAGLAGRFGMAGLGAGIGVGSNVIGNNMISNNTSNDPLASFSGTALNVAGGAIGGAMIGSAILPGIGTAIGAGVGAGAGIINSLMAANKQESAMKELEGQRREQRAATYRATNDPVVDALNSNFAALINTIQGNHIESKQIAVTFEKINKTTTIPKL